MFITSRTAKVWIGSYNNRVFCLGDSRLSDSDNTMTILTFVDRFGNTCVTVIRGWPRKFLQNPAPEQYLTISGQMPPSAPTLSSMSWCRVIVTAKHWVGRNAFAADTLEL